MLDSPDTSSRLSRDAERTAEPPLMPREAHPFLQRQTNRKHRSCSGVAFTINRPMMGLHNRLRDRQSEPAAARFTRSVLGYTKEAFKYSREMFLRDTKPLILKTNPDITVRRKAHTEAGSRRRVLDRIINEDEKQL